MTHPPHDRRVGAIRHRRGNLGRRPAIVAVAVTLSVTAGGYVAWQALVADPAQPVTLIAVEPRADSDTLAADVRTQLDRARNRGADVVIAGVFGASRGSVATASFGCEADTEPARCAQTRARQASKAEAAVDELLALPPPDRVDAFAAFRLAAVHLAQHSPDGPVRLFANLTGRHDRGNLAFDEPGLADRVDEVVAAVESADLMPTGCSGWQVHLVTPTSGDPAHDRARTEVVGRLLESCGGELAHARQHRPTRRPGGRPITALPRR
jgi:hypothetical protein